MIPFIIFIIALIGGYLHGIIGALSFGMVSLCGFLLIGTVLTKFSGGILPRRIRSQTAKDFIADHSQLLFEAWPNHSMYQLEKEVEGLLETMNKRSIIESHSFDVDKAANIQHFVASARLVALEQKSKSTQLVAQKLIDFIVPSWEG